MNHDETCFGLRAGAPGIARNWISHVCVWRALTGAPWVIAALVLNLVAATALAAPHPALLKREFIFENGPAPTNHPSTLVETRDGLLAVWINGAASRHPENRMYSARYNGTNWSAPLKVAENSPYADDARYQRWNPVPFQPSRGPLMLFYKVGPSPEGWWGMLMTSTNEGWTWSRPARLPDGFLGPVRNKPVELPDGSLLCGSSTEQGGWATHMERCFELGKRWEKTENLVATDGIETIQPTILRHAPDQFQILCRTKQGVIAQSWSKDGGKIWSPLRRTSLPNPNGAIDAVRLDDGRFLLVYNHSNTNRTTLDVGISGDGNAWMKVLSIEAGDGDYSYPAVIQSRDGLVHVVYSWNRERIRHAVLDPKLIQGTATITPGRRLP